MSDIITVRDGDIIAAEINVIKEHAAKVVISSAIEIGKRLVEAKAVVGHGNWGSWLAEKVDYSQSTANNMMKLYQEYGTGEVNLFDNWTNSEAFGKLSYTQHLALLALPFGERAEFAEQHQVADMSTRELEKAIRERDEAKADRDANLQEIAKLQEENDRITAGMAEAADKLEAKDAQMEHLQAQVNAAKDKQAAAEKKVENLKKKLEAANRAEAEARAELSQAKANPEISESLMEQLRAEAGTQAAEKATEEVRKQLAAAQEEAARANQAREAAEAQAADAKRQSQLSNPDMVLFSTYLAQAQEQFNKMIGALKKIKASNPEIGEKLKANTREKLLGNLGKALDMV